MRQTAYFESTEPLPPGVDFPEGPQVLQAGETEVVVEGPALVARPPRLLPSSEAAPSSDSALPETEFTDLFNGVDLLGWIVHEGKVEAWSVVDGVLTCTKASGGWLRTNQQFSDFELRFDVRLAEGANTGIGFRFPAAGSPTLTGFEVQLLDDAAAKYSELRPDQHSGSLYYQLPPLEHRSLPVGQWTPVVVHVRGDRIRVDLDGVTVNDVYLSQLPAGEQPHPLRTRPQTGFVGLQSSSGRVEFRHVRIKDLTTAFDSGLKTLDLVTGTGEVCPAGANVTVDYLGRFVDGQEFDSSYGRGEPLSVALDQVIDGWQQGIPGMRVGGRRKLIVPAALAYGEAGVKDSIPPGAMLIFEVELRRVER